MINFGTVHVLTTHDPRLDELLATTRELLRAVRKLQREEHRMTQEFKDLVATVEEQTTVDEGLSVLIVGAVTKIDELAGKIAAADDPAEIARLAGQIREHNAALRDGAAQLAAALTANTTPAPEPAPAPETSPEVLADETVPE